MIDNPETLTGVVLNGAHGIYDVHTDVGVLRCTLRGKLKKAFAQAHAVKTPAKVRPRQDLLLALPKSQRETQVQTQERRAREAAEVLPVRLTVGDYVRLRQLDAKSGMIEEILPRQSELSRKDVGSTANRSIQQTMLANLDQVALVFSTAHPEPHFGLLDRYLAICESASVRAIICLNKVDLPYESYVDEAAVLYQRLGYIVLWTSSMTGTGIDALRGLLKDRTTLFTGPSGVGKSSLVNAIEPGMAVKTGLVSEITGKGKHTTTGSQLYPLSGGGWLADSAGIRALATFNIDPQDLASCFIEFRPYLGNCQYSDCQHLAEANCAIRQAVQAGAISEKRYRSYERLLTGEER